MIIKLQILVVITCLFIAAYLFQKYQKHTAKKLLEDAFGNELEPYQKIKLD